MTDMRLSRALLIVAFGSAAVCGGCGSDSASQDRSPEGNRTPREIAYIRVQEDRIKLKLKDPESAEFRKSHVYYAIAPIVCGEVNSKNSFGGTNGFQRFVSGGDIQVLEEEMAAGEMDKTWAQVCK